MAPRKQASAKPLDADPQDTDQSALLPKRGRPLVFISHDSRDADFAAAFATMLTDVSAGILKSFRSSDKKASGGIEFGTEWYGAIMSQLSEATDVVALLTQQSLDRPWILYEAGVAKGKLNTNVLGVALGVPLEKVSSGPFAQFQNCADDEDSLTKLVLQLLKRNPDTAPTEEGVRMQVSVFLKRTSELLREKEKGKTLSGPPAEDSNVAKLFEEVKLMFRELPQRVDDRVRSVAGNEPRKRMRRFHPMMVEELLFDSALREGEVAPASAWLLVISMLKDDLPWLYEIGLVFYRALRGGDAVAIQKAKVELNSVLEAVRRWPQFRELFLQDKEEMYMIIHYIPKMLDRVTDIPLPQASHSKRATPKVPIITPEIDELGGN